MKPAAFLWMPHCVALFAAVGFFLGLAVMPVHAAATLTQQISPSEVNVGDEVTVTIGIQNDTGGGANIPLPTVDELQLTSNSSSTSISVVNGSYSSSFSQIFTLIATRAGDVTIPAFEVHTTDGQTLHTREMKLHVVASGAPPAPTPAPTPLPGISPGGPVILPPDAPADQNAAPATDAGISVPKDPDGRPAKVFLIVTPKTTDAYVGESIPLRIEFYIRMDADAPQDSLPTIKGSDFLMNDLSVRASEDEVNVGDESYHRYAWVTAISAPKSGDLPLQMENDTYWSKPSPDSFNGAFGGIFGTRPQLAHEMISSNQLVIHVHSLPEEGRPANFTGAIGQLRATGSATPDSVMVGEPVSLRFTVSGEGNFDYVKCPTLPNDPAWKSYTPSSRVEYSEESHTQGTKNFEMAIIPQKPGKLQLPPASFSYFDPNAKQYVTVPIALSEIDVTGSAAAPAAAATPDNSGSASTAPAAPNPAEFAPNRLAFGSLQASLTPVYLQPWFWAVQAGLVLLLIVGGLFLALRSRMRADDAKLERALRTRTLHRQEDVMADAVRRGDAVAFFPAARQAVQLHLAGQWNLRPEAITASEVRRRDPLLAETVEPLFNQADEVTYSGRVVGTLDLALWEKQVREILQLQPA